MTAGSDLVYAAFARGLQPDPDMPVHEWADTYMIIPKDSGASEYGKYRTSRIGGNGHWIGFACFDNGSFTSKIYVTTFICGI